MSRLFIQKNKPLNEEIKYQDEKMKANSLDNPNQGKVVKHNSQLKTILISVGILVLIAGLIVLVLILSGVIKV